MFSLTRLISEYLGVPTKEHGAISLFCAFIGAIVSHMKGWPASLSFLFGLVVGDFVTGIVASLMEGTGLKSKISFKGIAKKGMIFFMVLVGHMSDVALQINYGMNLIIYFYVVNELISIGENADRMGVPVPKQLVEIVQVLKGKNK